MLSFADEENYDLLRDHLLGDSDLEYFSEYDEDQDFTSYSN
jgi:hypothetical protein